jgi:hypothetical protein
VAGTAGPPPSSARAKLDDDPFAEANFRKEAPAAPLLEKADAEFGNGRYEAAGKLYAQAAQADKNVPAECRERWAYCKLFGVVKVLNRPAAGGPPAQELEREVRQAMSLAPKLDSFAKDLLRKIQERQPGPRPWVPEGGGETPAVAVRHTPRQPNQSYAVAETANFRIFHNQTREVAERAARAVEATRAAMSRKWFGDDGGTWNPRCDVYLHANAQDYSRATGVPATSPGHSTINSEGERVLARRIDLHCDDPNLFVGVLPHETTHVVLAGRFGNHAVPRWADEGMAVLTEPRERIDRHLRNLPQHHRDGQLFRVGDLMRLNDYPDPRLIGAFYAESVSLVEFLSREKDPRTFARFLREGLDSGYEAALRRHYGIKDFNELDQRWQRYALGQGGASAVAGRTP